MKQSLNQPSSQHPNYYNSTQYDHLSSMPKTSLPLPAATKMRPTALLVDSATSILGHKWELRDSSAVGGKNNLNDSTLAQSRPSAFNRVSNEISHQKSLSASSPTKHQREIECSPFNFNHIFA